MKPIGAIVTDLSTPVPLSAEVKVVLSRAELQARRDLALLGIINADALVQGALNQFTEKRRLCESPIEEMMLAALALMVVPDTGCFPPAVHDVNSGEPWPIKPVVIVPQFVIARYRLDFMVSITMPGISPVRLAVECDGRKYHTERRNVFADQARDKYLSAFGIATLRYTGQRIFRHGHLLAQEIVATAETMGRAA